MKTFVMLGLLICLLEVNAHSFSQQSREISHAISHETDKDEILENQSDNIGRGCHHNKRRGHKNYWKNKYYKDFSQILRVLNEIASNVNRKIETPPLVIPVPYPYFIETNNTEDVVIQKGIKKNLDNDKTDTIKNSGIEILNLIKDDQLTSDTQNAEPIAKDISKQNSESKDTKTTEDVTFEMELRMQDDKGEN